MSGEAGRTPADALPAEPAEGAPADIGWRDFYTDENLETLIARALENNRERGCDIVPSLTSTAAAGWPARRSRASKPPQPRASSSG